MLLEDGELKVVDSNFEVVWAGNKGTEALSEGPAAQDVGKMFRPNKELFDAGAAYSLELAFWESEERYPELMLVYTSRRRRRRIWTTGPLGKSGDGVIGEFAMDVTDEGCFRVLKATVAEWSSCDSSK